MSAEYYALYSRAEDLAEARGCVQENDCWREHVELALEELRAMPPAKNHGSDA